MRKLFIVVMSPLLLVALYDLIFYVPSALSGRYSDLGDFFPIYICLQSVFFVGFLLFLHSRTCMSKTYGGDVIEFNLGKGLSPWIYIVLFIACGGLFFFLLYSVFGSFELNNILSQNAKFYAKSKIGTAWVFFVYQFILFLMLFDIYKTGIRTLKVMVFISCVFLIALTGGRSSIIAYIMFLLFIAIAVYRVQIKTYITVLFLMFFFVILSANALLRGGDTTATVTDYVESDAFILDFNNSFILQDTIDYIGKNQTPYGVFLEDILFAFIPRAIYPDKPVSTSETRLVYKDMLADGRTTNITFGIYGNAVLNFGYVGLFFSFVLTFFSGVQYKRVVDRIAKRRTIDFIWLYYFMMFTIVLRGGYFNLRLFMSFIVVVAVIATYSFLGKPVGRPST